MENLWKGIFEATEMLLYRNMQRIIQWTEERQSSGENESKKATFTYNQKETIGIFRAE